MPDEYAAYAKLYYEDDDELYIELRRSKYHEEYREYLRYWGDEDTDLQNQ